MIIGITGKARSGKDTVGMFLAEELNKVTGQKYVIMAFGNELKLRLQKDFDLSYDQLWGNDKEVMDKRYPKPMEFFSTSSGVEEVRPYWTPREMMQFYGTDCMRAINDHFWIDQLFKVIDENVYENVIITDARFKDELSAVKKRGGFTIRVSKENLEHINGEKHQSEIDADDFECDFDVSNNGGFDDLKKSVSFIVEMMKKLQGGS